MASKKQNYIIIFNVLMAFFLVLSNQFILYAIEQRKEVVGEIGLIIDTNFVGPIELTPTYARNAILNLPIFVFIFTVVGNAILVLYLKRGNRGIISDEQNKIEG